MRRTRRWWAAVLVLGGGGVALLGLRWLDLHPITFTAIPPEPELRAQVPPLDGEAAQRGDVLLFVDPARIAASAGVGRFDRLDLSFSWMNLLDAELGAYAIGTPGGQGSGAGPGKFRAVVVSTSARDAADWEALEEAARGGAVVFADGGAPERPHWTGGFETVPGGALPGAAIHGADRMAFDAAPVDWSGRAHDARTARNATAAAAPPVFLRKSFGRGALVTHAGGFAAGSVARAYATMLQGAPASDDFRLEERFGDYPDIVEPDDLVADRRLRENEVPFADLFARAVTSLLDPPSEVAPPLPRLLWFPAGSNGVFLMTHDEDLRGGKASLGLCTWDRDLGVKGTVFAIAHPRLAEDWTAERDFPAAIAEAGGAVGLHWNQFPQPRGIGPIEPVQWVRTCADQAERLRALCDATADFAVNRNHYLVLRPHWSATFRILAAQGIRLDSTFGANKGRGYLFGAARPFAILDDNGLPLPVRELPFVNQEDWGGADLAYFRRLLEANSTRHKGAIVSLFHPHLIVTEDAGARLFEQVARLAAETGHAAWTFPEMLAFWEARGRARVRSSAAGPAATGGEADAPFVLRLTTTVDRSDMALGFPRDGHWSIGQVLVDGEPDGGAASGMVRIGALPYEVVPLRDGTHEVSIRYTRK